MKNSPFQFAGSRLKVQRAYSHIQELRAIFAAFLETDFCKVRVNAERDPGKNILEVASVAKLPPEIPLVIGDTVHNLRTALDYIAFFAVGERDDRIAFPVGKKRNDIKSSPNLRSIQEAFPDLAAFILDTIQPYEGGDFKAWEVSALDNLDKHRLLIPTLDVQRVTGICAKDENSNLITNLTVTILGGRSVGAIALSSRSMEITNHGHATAEVRFGPGSIFQNQPVIPTLMNLAQATAKAVEALKEFFVRNPKP